MFLVIVQLFACKDSERRAQRQTENEVFKFDYDEPHPVFSKDDMKGERRGKRKAEFSVFGIAGGRRGDNIIVVWPLPIPFAGVYRAGLIAVNSPRDSSVLLS